MILLCRAGLGKPSIAKYFSFKKIYQNSRVLSIYGRSYLIYPIIGTQIGANFTGESCKLRFKTIKKHPNPKTVKKSI